MERESNDGNRTAHLLRLRIGFYVDDWRAALFCRTRPRRTETVQTVSGCEA